MRILEINTVNFGSTGHIMLRIADLARSEGHEAVCSFYARRNKPADPNTIYIGNKISHNLHKKFSKYTGYNGRLSLISTWNFLRKVKKFNPDIIHIHNLHDRFINVPMLFKFIKKTGFHKMSIYFTLSLSITVVLGCFLAYAIDTYCPFLAFLACSTYLVLHLLITLKF